MALIIVALLLVLGMAFFQVIQGLYSSLIMAILSVLCAVLAFNYYEPMAQMLFTTQPAYAHAISLVALFVLPLLAMRILADKFLPANIVLGVWADRIGGGALGLVTGLICTGVLAVAVQMLPFGPSVMTYVPYNDALQRNQSLQPFRPDEFTLGLVKTLSAGSLAGGTPLSKAHEDLLLEQYAARNTAGKSGRVDALPDSMRILDVFQPSGGQTWEKDVPPNPLLETGDRDRLVVVRVEIHENARDEQDNWWRVPATHLRLQTRAGKSHYPLAYLGIGGGRVEAVAAPQESGLAQVGKLLVVREHSQLTPALVIDWVFRIAEDDEPDYVVFRRVAMAQVTGKPVPQSPLAKGMLNLQPIKK